MKWPPIHWTIEPPIVTHEASNGKDDGMLLYCCEMTKKANRNGKKYIILCNWRWWQLRCGRCGDIPTRQCSSLSLSLHRQRYRMFKWNFINKSCRAKIKCCHKNVILRAHSFLHCLSLSLSSDLNALILNVSFLAVVVVRVRSFWSSPMSRHRRCLPLTCSHRRQ